MFRPIDSARPAMSILPICTIQCVLFNQSVESTVSHNHYISLALAILVCLNGFIPICSGEVCPYEQCANSMACEFQPVGSSCCQHHAGDDSQQSKTKTRQQPEPHTCLYCKARSNYAIHSESIFTTFNVQSYVFYSHFHIQTLPQSNDNISTYSLNRSSLRLLLKSGIGLQI